MQGGGKLRNRSTAIAMRITLYRTIDSLHTSVLAAGAQGDTEILHHRGHAIHYPASSQKLVWCLGGRRSNIVWVVKVEEDGHKGAGEQ